MQAVSGNRFSVKSWTLVPPQLCLGSLSFPQWPLLVFLWPHHSHHVPWASPPPRPGWGPVLLVACCQSLMAFPYHRLIVLLTKEKESYKSVIHMASTLQSLDSLAEVHLETIHISLETRAHWTHRLLTPRSAQVSWTFPEAAKPKSGRNRKISAPTWHCLPPRTPRLGGCKILRPLFRSEATLSVHLPKVLVSSLS